MLIAGKPEYPLATAMPADPSNYRKGRIGTGYLYVVIHITDGRERAEPVAKMWQEPNHGSSAHFVIGQGGGIIQAVSLFDTAWHAHIANSVSVGIEHCARQPGEPAFGKNDPGLPVSFSQYAASAKLAAWLCKRAGLQPTRSVIKGHCEIDPNTTHTDCPNSIWDWPRYTALVQAEYAALATTV